MPRRVSLPGASELFRPTLAPEQPATESPAASGPAASDPGSPDLRATAADRSDRGSGRVRHDEKITVYVSSDELLALERARLTLRAEHGMAVDRGRIVREAIASAMADLADHGADSELIRRLSQP